MTFRCTCGADKDMCVDCMAAKIECLEHENVDLRIQLEEYKQLYDLRGKALQRPCTICGHSPSIIKTI